MSDWTVWSLLPGLNGSMSTSAGAGWSKVVHEPMTREQAEQHATGLQLPATAMPNEGTPK